MNKDRQYVGIDISKDTFDACFPDGGHSEFDNQISGFRKLLKKLPEFIQVVMELTGPYHLKLALFLIEHSVPVSVVNGLTIKRRRLRQSILFPLLFLRFMHYPGLLVKILNT